MGIGESAIGGECLERKNTGNDPIPSGSGFYYQGKVMLLYV
ncbi:hypothetical protein DSBG_4229 [Desulfosporosinus sp. BG]|nr:hypothetical protein DSBG_4229 [Desulfosporosinus sp. BG]